MGWGKDCEENTLKGQNRLKNLKGIKKKKSLTELNEN